MTTIPSDHDRQQCTGHREKAAGDIRQTAWACPDYCHENFQLLFPDISVAKLGYPILTSAWRHAHDEWDQPPSTETMVALLDGLVEELDRAQHSVANAQDVEQNACGYH